MKNKRKKSLIIGVLLLILGLGLGYAFLTTTLNIQGTTDVDSNTWDVYWDNVQVTSGSVTASTPIIDTNKTTVTFSAHLSKPGDFYEFTVDAKNDGTIDAMIDTITSTVNGSPSSSLPEYLNYTVTYSDDVPLMNKQLIESGGKETYKVRVEYRTDIEANALPSTPQTITFSTTVSYAQADSEAFPKPKKAILIQGHAEMDLYFIEGMTWEEWINSSFNTDDPSFTVHYHDTYGIVAGRVLSWACGNNVYLDQYNIISRTENREDQVTLDESIEEQNYYYITEGGAC